jgi:hypothetical protein
MSENTRKLDNVIQIDEAQVRGHLSELVRGSVEETLNGLLDAEADDRDDGVDVGAWNECGELLE